MKYIYINPNGGRFANQLFPIFVAVSMYEEGDYGKIYLNNHTQILNYNILNNKFKFTVCNKRTYRIIENGSH